MQIIRSLVKAACFLFLAFQLAGCTNDYKLSIKVILGGQVEFCISKFEHCRGDFPVSHLAIYEVTPGGMSGKLVWDTLGPASPSPVEGPRKFIYGEAPTGWHVLKSPEPFRNGQWYLLNDVFFIVDENGNSKVMGGDEFVEKIWPTIRSPHPPGK